MKYARAALAALARGLTGPRGARAGRFALVTGAHVLVICLLLRIPEIQLPVEAQAESFEITFFDESHRPPKPHLGTVEPKLKKLKIEMPLLPKVRIPHMPAVATALRTPPVRSDSLVAAAPSVPQPGVGSLSAGSAGVPDHPTLIVSRVLPSYPIRASLARERGSVLIGLEVDPRGRLIQVKVLRSSGSRDLDQAAAAAVGRWKFRAAAQGGQPIRMSIEINFSLTCGTAPRLGETQDARNGGCLDRSRAAGAWRFQR